MKSDIEYHLNIFKEELGGFLPRRIFDTHVHLFGKDTLSPAMKFEERSCYRKFGCVFTLEQMLEWSDVFLPGRELFVNSFGRPALGADRDKSAVYTGGISDNRRYFGMALVSPRDSVEEVRRRVVDNDLIGYKPYLNFVDWKSPADVTISDMLPDEQLEAANSMGLAVTLHIPRTERLADPLNQRQMREICLRWPNVSFIFAHIGRAYYLSNVEGYLEIIADCPNAFVDTAMVNHEGVLEYTFRNFPRERILFGSDAPIALLLGKSVEINNQYAYLLGEDYAIGTSIFDSKGAIKFTSFFYEQLRGMRLAALRAGLTAGEVEALFFTNAHELFAGIAKSLSYVG